MCLESLLHEIKAGTHARAHTYTHKESENTLFLKKSFKTEINILREIIKTVSINIYVAPTMSLSTILNALNKLTHLILTTTYEVVLLIILAA